MVTVRSVPVAAASTPAARVLAATITCLGRWGLAKTTLDDIAREAGLSRATVYRLFPGGKDTVVSAAVEAELDAIGSGLLDAAAGLDDLADVLVAVVTHASRALRDHQALHYLIAHEPELILPHLAFAEFDRVLDRAAALLGPLLEGHVGADAPRTAEWIARLVCSYTLAPSPWFDLTDEADARRLLCAFVLPGLTPERLG